MFVLNTVFVYIPLVVFVWIPLYIWYTLRQRFLYWDRHGVPSVRGAPILGNMKPICFFQRQTANHFNDLYMDDRCKDSPVVGIHVFLKPALIIKDLELIRAILIKDFASFSNRPSSSDLRNDLIGGGSLFFIKNLSWKSLRIRLTPTFTSGKMKQTFELMREVGSELNNLLLKTPIDPNTKSFCKEMGEIFACYATDIIASCSFGLKANSLSNPECDFRKESRRIFYPSFMRTFELSCVFFIPEIVPWLKIKAFGSMSNKFMRESINYAMDSREKSGEIRNDLIDTLVVLRNEDKGKLASETELVFQGDALVAQAALFFVAGFENSASLLAFGLFELCRRPFMQQRLRNEIKSALQLTNGELTYEMVTKMEYLGMIVSEILRMYPSLPFLDRECTIADNLDGYDLRPFGLDYRIPKGMPIYIPAYSLHRDPNYWPDPDTFDPERFSPQNLPNITPMSYLPFGVGQRDCIAKRFGMLQVKIGFINYFRNHRVEQSDKTPIKPNFERNSFLIQAENGIHVNSIRDPII